MKRLFVAAGLAVAALSLPATAALADGYEPRHHAKPKPKTQLKRQAAPKAQARKHHPHAQYRQTVRDFGAVYCCQRSQASYSFEQFEKTETSYYEERNGHAYGPVVSYSERYVNPQRGCHPHAPCGYSTGQQAPAHFYYGGHPGGVGFGVDGGPVYGGSTVFIVPGGGFRSHHAHGAAGAAAHAYGSSHSYYSGGMHHGAYGGGYGHAGAAFPPSHGHPGYHHPGKSWQGRR
jgi:hypothetical protein